MLTSPHSSGRVLEFLENESDPRRGVGAAPVDDASAMEPVEPRGRAKTDAAARAAAANANAVLRPPGAVPALRDNVALRGWICTAFRARTLVVKLNAAVKVPERVAEFYYPYSLLAIECDYNQLCKHLELLQELPCIVDPGVRLRSASLTADPQVTPAGSQSPKRGHRRGGSTSSAGGGGLSTPTESSRSRSGSGSAGSGGGGSLSSASIRTSGKTIPWNHVIYARNNVEVSASSGALDEAVEAGRASLGYLQVFSRDDAWDIKLESQDSLLRISDLKLTWTSNENLARSATAAERAEEGEDDDHNSGSGEVESPQPQPLPPGWDSGYDPVTGETYYIDHATQTTTWDYPGHLVTALALEAAVAALANTTAAGDVAAATAIAADGASRAGGGELDEDSRGGSHTGGATGVGLAGGGAVAAAGSADGDGEPAVGFNVNGSDIVGPWTSDSTEIDLLAVAPSLVAIWRNPINPDAGCIAISCGLPGVQPGCVIFMLKRGVRFLSAALRRCAGCRLVIVPSRDIHGQVICPEPIATSVWDNGSDANPSSSAGANTAAAGAGDNGGSNAFSNIMPGEPLTPGFGSSKSSPPSPPPLSSAPWAESPSRPSGAAGGDDGGGAAAAASSVTAADLISFETWFACLNEEGQVKDWPMFQKLVFFRGLQPEIRTMIWPYLLGVYTPDLTHAGKQQRQRELVAEYDKLKLEWQCVPTSESEGIRFQLKNISKDVVRTDRDHPLFSGEGNPILKVMMDIIMTYSHVHPSIEYYQGMTDLLASLLIVTMDEAITYHCFCSQMNQGGGADFGQSDEAIHQQLADIGAMTKVCHPEFYAYLETCYLSGMLFCYRWVLLDFRREFRRAEIFHLWETLWCQQRCKDFNLLVAVSILDLYAPTPAEYGDASFNSLEYFSNLALTMDFQAVLRKARELVYTLNTPDHGLPTDTWLRVVGDVLPVEDRRSSIAVAEDIIVVDGKVAGGGEAKSSIGGNGLLADDAAGSIIDGHAGVDGAADSSSVVASGSGREVPLDSSGASGDSAALEAPPTPLESGTAAAVAAAEAYVVRGSTGGTSSAGGSDVATAAVRAAAASPCRSASMSGKYSGNSIPEVGVLKEAPGDIAAEVAAAITLDAAGNHVAALAAYMQAIDSLLDTIRTGGKIAGGVKPLKRYAKNLLLRAEYLKGSL